MQVFYQEKLGLEPESEQALRHYVDSTIERFKQLGSVKDPQVISAARDRLYRVKNATNLLRKYQKYTRLVFRYRQSEFPNRYVELF